MLPFSIERVSPGAGSSPAAAARTRETRLAHRSQPLRRLRAGGAFTLIELIAVLAIIGLLAAVSLPAMKNIRKTNSMVAAGRQLVDDLNLARAKAIGERTTVHVIFVPPEIMTPFAFNTDPTPEGLRDRKLGERLKSGQFASYALFADRTVGDQPGQPRFRYLTSWKTLPEGVFIATNKFINDLALWGAPGDYGRPFEYAPLHFPTSFGVTYPVPHVAFDSQGRLVNKDGQLRFQNEVIPLARGSILYSRRADGTLDDIDVRQSPDSDTPTNYHRVVIDGLTGRSRVETPQIQ